jgi:hypothetical protein
MVFNAAESSIPNSQVHKQIAMLSLMCTCDVYYWRRCNLASYIFKSSSLEYVRRASSDSIVAFGILERDIREQRRANDARCHFVYLYVAVAD